MVTERSVGDCPACDGDEKDECNFCKGSGKVYLDGCDPVPDQPSSLRVAETYKFAVDVFTESGNRRFASYVVIAPNHVGAMKIVIEYLEQNLGTIDFDKFEVRYVTALDVEMVFKSEFTQ